MSVSLENIFAQMATEYGMQQEQLIEYAEKGCRINHRIALNEYVQEFPMMLDSNPKQEEFLSTIITIGMAETLHDIVKASPFTKIRYPKPRD